MRAMVLASRGRQLLRGKAQVAQVYLGALHSGLGDFEKHLGAAQLRFGLLHLLQRAGFQLMQAGSPLVSFLGELQFRLPSLQLSPGFPIGSLTVMDLVAVKAREHLSLFDVRPDRLATRNNDAFGNRAQARGGVLVDRKPSRNLQFYLEFPGFRIGEGDARNSDRILVETNQARVVCRVSFDRLRFGSRLRFGGRCRASGPRQHQKYGHRQGSSPEFRFQSSHGHQFLPKSHYSNATP